ATRLDDAAALLIDRWSGDLRRVRDEGEADSSRLSSLLQEFTGIGQTGAHVFLREVQAVWPQVRPHVDPLVRKGAKAAELPEEAQTLAGLVDDDEIAALAAALVRVARAPSLMDDLGGWAAGSVTHARTPLRPDTIAEASACGRDESTAESTTGRVELSLDWSASSVPREHGRISRVLSHAGGGHRRIDVVHRISDRGHRRERMGPSALHGAHSRAC